MIEIKRDWNLLIEATECCRYMAPISLLEDWWKEPRHLMLVEDDNVGLATFEYPGLYDVHWFYQSARGRQAIALGRRMIGKLFEEHGAECLRGLIRTELKASKWACRQLGFKSHGIVSYPEGDSEVFCMTKDQYLEGQLHG